MITKNELFRYFIENVEKAIREAFGIPSGSNIHLWTKSTNQLYEELPQKKQTIQELSLMSSQTVVAEVQNDDGTWPRKPTFSKRLCFHLSFLET